MLCHETLYFIVLVSCCDLIKFRLHETWGGDGEVWPLLVQRQSYGEKFPICRMTVLVFIRE